MSARGLKSEISEGAFLTATEVAKILSLSVKTVLRLAKTDGFPKPVRWNKKLLRWKKVDVLEYVQNLRTG